MLSLLDNIDVSADPAPLLIQADIVKSVVSIPGELIKLKVDYSTANKGLLEAQKNELDAKQKLIEQIAKDSKINDGEPSGQL